MQAMTAHNTTAPANANGLQLSLFDEYISFIGRGEKTTRTYITNLRQFAAWIRYSSITAPARKDIIAYRDYLATEHDAIQLDNSTPAGYSYRTDKSGKRYRIKCAAATIKLYLQSVCAFFKWTAANGLYPDIAANVHAPKVRQDTHKKEALTAADVQRIESSIDRTTEQGKRLFAMFTLAVNNGLRTIEISRANIKDIELISGTAYLYIHGKGHAEADTKKPLAPAVYEAVTDYLQARTDTHNTSSPLFVSTGNRSGGERIATTTISKMLKKCMQAAGYNSNRITAHSLRHTCGTSTQEITGNLFLTQHYMRHANPATTEIYLHNATEKQETGIAARLYNYYHGCSTASDTREKLNNIIESMSASQIEQLAGVAAAMAN